MQRLADPYRDLDVIDSRGPRTNQAAIGVLSLLAVLTGWWWLLALLALQLALGADARAALVPRLRRVLRADPAALRRRAARGRTTASDCEHGRARRPHAPASLAYAAGWASLGAASGCSSRRSRSSPRDGLLHRLRGVQARLPAPRRAVRVLPDPGQGR
jgi:hypothetical protein